MYLDAADIESLDFSDSIYTLGALKIHHVKRLDLNTVKLYLKKGKYAFKKCLTHSLARKRSVMIVYHIAIYQSLPVIVLITLLHDTGVCVKSVHYHFPKFVKHSHEDYHF